jgi:hypothetical protein
MPQRSVYSTITYAIARRRVAQAFAVQDSWTTQNGRDGFCNLYPFKTQFQSRGEAPSNLPMIRLNSRLHPSTKFSERWNSTNRFAAADNLYALASCSARSSASANTSGSYGSHSRPSENFGTMYANHPLFAANTIFPAVAA